ncbi:hypothetical protein CLOM_g16948 [Closterium sp. NIES-68]|nr:hypothetical protein CLOM_g16948 [Closterium sp. NIES-68]GJP85333.1 hypothetical protein CLOP_g15440 [Closterium sp. NIES-67]
MAGHGDMHYPLHKSVANFVLSVLVVLPSLLIARKFIADAKHLPPSAFSSPASPPDIDLTAVAAAAADATGGGNPEWWWRVVAWGVRRPIGCVCALFALNVDVLFWVISLLQRSTWLIDPYWTFIPPLILEFYSAHPAASTCAPRARLVRVVLLLWSARLTHSYLRREQWRWGWREDWRFSDMRRQYGRHWWWLSFPLVYVFQHVLLVGLTLPLYAVHASASPLSPLDLLAASLALTGIVTAAVADTQLHAFMTNNDRLRAAGKPSVLLLDSGIWRYSRHPNYFGEQLFWWALALWGWNAGMGWTVVGTVVNSLCMVAVTVLVEKRMRGKEERREMFEAYCRRTSMWVPWFAGKQGKVE